METCKLEFNLFVTVSLQQSDLLTGMSILYTFYYNAIFCLLSEMLISNCIFRHHTLHIRGEFVPYSPVSSRTCTKMGKLKIAKVVLQDVLTDLISGKGMKEFLDLKVDSFVESFANFRCCDGTVDTTKCKLFNHFCSYTSSFTKEMDLLLNIILYCFCS